MTTAERFDVAKVSRLLGTERAVLVALGGHAHRMYRSVRIAEDSKVRVLDIPNERLKACQRALLDRVLQRIPVSESVFSVSGKGVIANAQQHLCHPHMAVLDISDCFPSIRVDMVRGTLERVGFSREAAHLVTQLTTVRGALPQGAPTSPAVMNLVLGELDSELEERARSFGATYTRYMDDLCFSGPVELGALARYVRAALCRRRFRYNPAKSRLWGPSDPHTVTKIVVSTELNARPEYIRALTTEIAKCRRGELGLTAERLRAQVAWVKALNRRQGHMLEMRLGWALHSPRAA